MKKGLFILVSVLVVCLVCMILFVDLALQRVSDLALEHLVAESASQGIKVEFAKVEQVRLRGLKTVVWNDFVAVVSAPRYISLSPGEDVVVSIGEIRLDLPRLWKGVAAVAADDIGVRVKRNDFFSGGSDALMEGLKQGQLLVELPINVTSWDKATASLSGLQEHWMQFLTEGRTTIPFGFRARSAFVIGSSIVDAEISAVKQGGYFFLVMSPNHLRKIAVLLQSELTEEETRLVSLRPLLAPALFKITNRARKQAAALFTQDAAFPEDAYRHVLWSYLLTKEFGPGFAEQITNAHEIGSVERNTEADHRMDFNNNRVGREYAKAGHAEKKILELVMTDPQVIRSPRP
jgi:hypothetical protein